MWLDELYEPPIVMGHLSSLSTCDIIVKKQLANANRLSVIDVNRSVNKWREKSRTIFFKYKFQENAFVLI